METLPEVVSEESARLPPLRILVVDDNQAVADSTVTALELHGHQAHAVYNGLDALTTALHYRPDLVLLDLAMPHTSGYIVVRRLKADPVLKDVPVIMVTGNDTEMERLIAMGAGCDAFLPKPMDWRQVEGILNKTTRRGA